MLRLAWPAKVRAPCTAWNYVPGLWQDAGAQTPCMFLPNQQSLVGNTGACLFCLVSDLVPVGEVYSVTSVCSCSF